MAYLKFGVHGAGVGGNYTGFGIIVSTKGTGAQIMKVAL